MPMVMETVGVIAAGSAITVLATGAALGLGGPVGAVFGLAAFAITGGATLNVATEGVAQTARNVRSFFAKVYSRTMTRFGLVGMDNRVNMPKEPIPLETAVRFYRNAGLDI